MNNTEHNHVPKICRGLRICCEDTLQPEQTCIEILERLQQPDLVNVVVAGRGFDSAGSYFFMHLADAQVQAWAPHLDTLRLAANLQLDTVASTKDLQREIVVAMLMGPVAFEFPSVDELISAVRIRINIVLAARKTTLAFHTTEAERPQECWRYDEDYGFAILPGTSLTHALQKATQPEISGALYSFSCYRASEYVILLAIAQELETCNPALYAKLQTLWTQYPIKSGLFHEIFLRELGSMQDPLPPKYFVPGDRTWFRNPDEQSSDASGFEGSWVMYLGNGLFSNFWQSNAAYTLTEKCLEIYHWRHGVYCDANGQACMDEAKVADLVAATQKSENEVLRICEQMQRYREPRGVYTSAGGCMDTTREFARWVHPTTSDLHLPHPKPL